MNKNNRALFVSLVAILLVSMGLIGCGGEEVPEYNLTISSTEGGEVSTPGEGAFSYDEGTVVPLLAFPHTGYRFVDWTGDVSTIADVEDASTTIVMDAAKNVTANFAPLRCNLTVDSREGGSVATPGEGTFTYDYGTVIDLVATPDDGYQFADWTGDVGTVVDVNAASTTVTMKGDYIITASFAKEIRDWHDLDAIRDNLGGSYVLMTDLDSTTPGYAELASLTANGGKGWQPIGTEIEPFTGILWGRRLEIRELFIDRPDEDCVGFLGYVGQGGVIGNIEIVNATVTGSSSVGGLAGRNQGGTVRDCYSTGSVTGQSNVGGLVGLNGGDVTHPYSAGGGVINCYSTSTVAGQWKVGGLVGENWFATVIDSHSGGGVTGASSVGGLVGSHSWGTVGNSYYDYDEVLINGKKIITIGALVGEDFEQWLANDKILDVNERLAQEDGYYVISNVADFKQLLAFGQDSSLKFRLANDLDLAAEPDLYVPYLAGEFDGNGHRIANLSFNFDSVPQIGLFGVLASGGKVTKVGVDSVDITGADLVGGLVGWNDGTITNSYASGSVTGTSGVAGLVGRCSGVVRDSYASCSVSGQGDVGGLAGWSGGTLDNSFYDYDKVLINGKNVISGGALFHEDFDEWLATGKSFDLNERLTQEDGYYVINDVADLKQLLAFGQDSSLKFRLANDLDLTAEPDFYVPYLAGEFDGNGHKISNLSFNFDFVSRVGLFGYLHPGAKVSEVGVENVKVTGSGYVGGLVGDNRGSTVSESYSTGIVAGGGIVGGLIGENLGPLRDSYSTCSVTGNGEVGGLVGWNSVGSVRSSYSTGSVGGYDEVGGLVGSNQNIVSDSFWDIETSGQSTSAGGTGKTTAEMKNLTTFTGAGWNIIAVVNPDIGNPSYIWNIVDGQAYPFLSWQATPSDTLQVQDVTAQEAFDLTQENHGDPDFIILDVRTSLEFHDGHIEGALNIDVNLPSFREELDQLDRNDTYLVYCRSGSRSRAALAIMEELGFTRVYHLANGITEWVDAGFPVTQ